MSPSRGTEATHPIVRAPDTAALHKYFSHRHYVCTVSSCSWHMQRILRAEAAAFTTITHHPTIRQHKACA